jgi:hypothetical protein
MLLVLELDVAVPHRGGLVGKRRSGLALLGDGSASPGASAS